MAIINRKTGMVTGPTKLFESVVGTQWKGMQSSRDFASEINMPITARLIESHQSWTESAEEWAIYPLELRAVWDWAAGMLGSAHHQMKIMSMSNAKNIVKRSRGVLMSGYNYFKKCWELRRVAGFEKVKLMRPPTASKPMPLSLVECYWDNEIDGIWLEIEDSMLTSFDAIYSKIRATKNRLDQLSGKAKEPLDKRAIEELDRDIRQFEDDVRQKQARGEGFNYDEQKGVVWSAFRRGTASDGIISALIDLPMGNYIKLPDGSFKLGSSRRPVGKFPFTELPSCNRQLCPNGFVALRDMSLFHVKFVAETIVATKGRGALVSYSGNLLDIKTPERHHQAAEEFLALSRKLNNERCARQRHARIIRRQLTDEKANEKPFVWKNGNTPL